MRVIAVLLSLGLLGLAAWNGRGLWQQLQTPLSETRVLSAAVPTANPDNAVARLQVRRWPALFGQFQRPEPQPPKPPEPPQQPQPPKPPQPPIESLGYRLQGVVRNGSANWAIVNHPTGTLSCGLVTAWSRGSPWWGSAPKVCGCSVTANGCCWDLRHSHHNLNNSRCKVGAKRLVIG